MNHYATFLALTVGCALAAQDNYLTIVFDNSGSMSSSSGGTTRIERARTFAKADIDNFFFSATSPHVAIYHFNGNCGVTRLPNGSGGWYATAGDAKTQIDALATGALTGNTPLFPELCRAVTDLVAMTTVPAAQKAICIYSVSVLSAPSSIVG